MIAARSFGDVIERGKPFPLGANVRDGGVNFSVFSRRATLAELLLFDRVDAAEPTCVIALAPGEHRTYHYWHVFVRDVRPGQIYAWRVSGPMEPESGLRFDGDKLLLDPYGRAIAVPARYSRAAAAQSGPNAAVAMKSVVTDASRYDWEGDLPLARPFAETVIYEMHVGGFTRHPSSGIAPDKRGTFAGLIEKIPYLQDLGVTALELLPVFHFDAHDAPPGRVNYWGYSPVSFFAPHAGYSSRAEPLGVLDEFRDMVKALHHASIEVILDVVFNHTAEGDHTGPTLCFRGFDNAAYYILDHDRARYANYSGTGNTLNANHSIVRRLILDSLRYWVAEMHVDGFRFDLASILARDENGHPLEQPPILWDIETDPVLAGTKLIAEAWDAAGLYQVGKFIGDSWKEWNGKFRDDVRSFMKGDRGVVGRFAHRLCASPDLYSHEEREAEQSINFITCHDGFTLNDLVSYNGKHNEANGEQNRDGADDNRSWNCGFEGPSEDPAIEGLRNRQAKNFLALTLIALGTPMLLMGDEVRRTQHGNNNAYCQDNEISWFDWSLIERHRGLFRFVKTLIAQRLRLVGMRDKTDLSLIAFLRHAEVQFHGVRLGQPDWSDDSHSLALTARNIGAGAILHIMINAYWEPLEFELPVQHGWRRWIDSARASPDDIVESGWPAFDDRTCVAQPRSLVALVAPFPSNPP